MGRLKLPAALKAANFESDPPTASLTLVNNDAWRLYDTSTIGFALTCDMLTHAAIIGSVCFTPVSVSPIV